MRGIWNARAMSAARLSPTLGLCLALSSCSLEQNGRLPISRTDGLEDASVSTPGTFPTPSPNLDADSGTSQNSAVRSADYEVVAHGGHLAVSGTGLSQIQSAEIGNVTIPLRVESDAQLTLGPFPDDVPIGRQPVRLRSAAGTTATFETIVIHLVINEMDQETNEGADRDQFVEIGTSVSDLSLRGYILVLFDGSDGNAYGTVELANPLGVPTRTDADGRLLITDLPTEAIVGRNDPSALAIYQLREFQEGTAATENALIDAVAYTNRRTDHDELINTLLIPEGRIVLDEDENNDEEDESIQRCNAARRDGRSFSVADRTPGESNECS